VRFLDPYRAREIATDIIMYLEDDGHTTEEIIPGLIQAVIELAQDDDRLLDEAANLLADGGVPLD
jgi:hypothetical protein